MDGLRRTPIHRVLHRPHLLLGGDRQAVMFTALACGALGLEGGTKISLVVAVAFWFCGLFFFRKMAKADPLMAKIYFRNRKYRRFYRSRSTPWRNF